MRIKRRSKITKTSKRRNGVQRIQAPTCCHARSLSVFVEDGVRVTPFACPREKIHATELAISKEPAFISEMQNDRVGSCFGLKSI